MLQWTTQVIVISWGYDRCWSGKCDDMFNAVNKSSVLVSTTTTNNTVAWYVFIQVLGLSFLYYSFSFKSVSLVNLLHRFYFVMTRRCMLHFFCCCLKVACWEALNTYCKFFFLWAQPQSSFRLFSCGGFFLVCKNLGGMFSNSFPACTFFFKVEISLRTLIPLFMPGSVHSGSASWDDCDWVFPDELHVSSFSLQFPYYARTAA